MDSFKELIRNNIVAFGILISVAWVASSFVLAGGLASINKKTAISVTGTAERMVESDAGKWTFMLTKQASPSQYAQVSESLSEATGQAVQFMESKGVELKSVTVQPITSNVICQSQQQVMYDRMGNQQCAGSFTYNLVQTVIIESSNVNLLKELTLTAPGALLGRGIQLQTMSLDFFYSKLGDIRAEMLAEASKNARERAEAIAKSAGNSIGGVREASQGVFQVTQRNSTEVSDYGSYDTSTIEKKITAIVRASFEVR